MRAQSITKALRDAFDVSKGRAKFSTIRERIVSAARVDGIHLCQLIAAMIIASVGLNINSTEAVIGAMLICPLMGSVLALALAVASMDMHIARHAFGGMLLQCGICLVTSTLYFAISPLSNETSELLTNSSATIWDVTIALVGGFAGALGISRRQEPSTLLAGVAVATALMPPLCSTGYGLALGDGVLALSAIYEFAINVLFIAFGATVVLSWLHMPLRGDLDGDGHTTSAEIAEADLPVVTLGESLTYNEKAQTQKVVSVRLGNVDITEFCDVADNVATNVGKYELTVSAKPDGLFPHVSHKFVCVNSIREARVILDLGRRR